MHISLPGYQIQKTIHQGAKTTIYQAKRESDSLSVIIKTLRAEYPTLEEITRLRHEHQILQDLDIESVIQPYALIDYQHSLALILEEFGGVPLKQLIGTQNFSIKKFLEIAIAIAQTLDELHIAQVIHKDIKPQNILINPQTGQIKLIDFSIATRLETETQGITSPNQLEGTLAYMSPEQTGRMNRSVDYRTDFYSLGITFYEMLTGQLPFSTDDTMEIVHCHIAKTPIAPHQLNSSIPETISAIIMKLVAKTAEDRYQSDRGLKADLEKCLKQWQSHNKIENFTPGKLDRVGRFLIPQKLYGRETEVSILLEAFERVSQGNSELMLVSGYSGIGKTCVVQEIHKPIVRQRGYFISGKFDQFKRDIPYAAIVQVFQELIQQILTESSQNIAIWKEELLAAFGENGGVLSAVIPEIEMIIGMQPEISKLGASESQNRFNQVFKQFVSVFSKPKHPLVIFLDDLQWADTASLKLLELLITDPDSQYLLVLGAYRDNEVSPTHATILTIEEIQKAGAIVNNVTLQPLEKKHIFQLVADTLNFTQNSQSLSDLLYNKTQGNPFFLTQLFKTLYAEKLLSFDFTQETWQWNIEKIQGFGISDLGVVELVARNIKKLPEQTQNLLKLGACIGNRFYLEILAIVNEKSLVETADGLWPALQSGLLLPLNKDYKIPLAFNSKNPDTSTFNTSRISYRFLHDRVQQAAYSLIPEAEKKSSHLKIGQLLLQKTNKAALEENVFDIVNQLNIGLDLIVQKSQSEEILLLNLMAGKKAKLATAYTAAVRYFNIALDLLPENGWQTHYDLTRDLYLETLETEYLNINFERAESLAELILSKTKNLLDRVEVYEKKIPFYSSQNEMELALNTALQILKMLGISLPAKPTSLNIIINLIFTKLAIGNKQVENLETLPTMTDPYKLASIRIILAAIPTTFMVNPLLFPIFVFKAVSLSVKFGNSPLSAYAYELYGLVLSGPLGDIDAGYKFGCLGIKLLDQWQTKEIYTPIHLVFNQSVRFWKEPIRGTKLSLTDTFKKGIENGDIQYSCYAALINCYYIFFAGEHLPSLAKTAKSYIEMMQKLKNTLTMYQLQVLYNFISALAEGIEQKNEASQDFLNEQEILPILTESKNNAGIACLYLNKLIWYYLFKDWNAGLEATQLTEQYKEGIQGSLHFAIHTFYDSLVLLAHFPNTDKRQQKKYLKKIKTNQKQMQKWAHHAPMNFQHKYDLVEAEKYRVLGNHDQAAPLYDRAIAGAKTNGYIQEEALANELAAEFYHIQGRKNIAKTYMTDAYYSYIRWGAKAKLKDLDQRYPDLIARSVQESILDNQITATTTNTSITSTYGETTTISTTGLASQVLDLNTVFKASLALSGELVVENLLEKLLKISIENAGANLGLFLSKQDEQWIVEAMGKIDEDRKPDEADNEIENTNVSVAISVSSQQTLPLSLLNYVEQTKKSLVLDDASTDGLFSKDPYIQEKNPKSILCTPLIHQNKLTGILYLENNETSGAFTQDRLKVINLLASQISISVDNARLYTQLEGYSRTLESKVEERTQQLSEKNSQLKVTLKELKSAQKQIVAQEKLASLGSLTAGIAHEIRNPLNFVNSLANLSQDLTQDIAEEIDRQAEKLDPEAVEFINESLDYLKRNVSEIHQQGKRADSIITSMLMHARTGSSTRQAGDINFVVSEAVQLAHQSLRAKDASFNVELNTEYDDSIGQIFLAAADLGRGIINIVDNACYAARKKFKANPDGEFVPIVTVTTTNRDSEVEIRICDNGNGITPEIKEKIFNPFFTTKPTGEGTGLGLSISHDIIVGQHQGSVQIESEAGNYTHFIIILPRSLPGDDEEHLQSDRENEEL